MINGRYTVGLITANICDPFSNTVSKGAMKAAEELDINLIIVPVKYFGLDQSDINSDVAYEYMYNALLSHVASGNLDYIIVCTGSIAYPLSKDGMKKILDFIEDTPVLSLAADIDGYEYMVFDNKSGIKEAVSYLIHNGRTHIGVMKGAMGNPDCIERLSAYRESLEENGIEYDENLTIECELSTYCKKEVEELIARNPQMDAIMCVNDSVATTVYKVLKKQGKIIGRDIAVVGFDDLPFAQQLEPPLSSIKADSEMMGYKAVYRAAEYLSGKTELPKNECIETNFIPRESCSDQRISIDYTDIFSVSVEQSADKMIKYIFADYLSDEARTEIRKNYVHLIGNVKEIFFGDVIDADRFNQVLADFESYIDRKESITQNTSKVLRTCDLGFSWLMSNITSEKYIYAVKLYTYFYQKLTSSIINSKGEENVKTLEINHRSNLITRDILMFDNSSVEEGYSSMLRKIHHLGISTGYLYILDTPMVYHDKEFFPKDVVWKLVAYHFGSNTYSVPTDKQIISEKQLFKNEFLPPERRYTYVMADLYSNEVQYGFALFELQYEYFDYLEYLTYQVSAAVKILELIKTQKNTLEKLNESNLALENISSLDELTGALNRRGFYRNAHEQFENGKGKLTVIFADLDDLKKINDSFGHTEGDCAIRAIADCLREAMGDDGIVGRVGGDEFVAITMSTFDNMESILRERCQMLIERYNNRVAKPYRTSMSMGIFECNISDYTNVSEVIDRADYLLYVQKRKKKERRNSTLL